MVPTKRESSLYKQKWPVTQLLYNIRQTVSHTENREPQFIYVLSDEQPKENDWISANGIVTKCEKLPLPKEWKKVIAANDPKLLIDDVLPISRKFIQGEYIDTFNKFGKIDKVLVDYGKSCDLDIFCQFGHKGEPCKHDDILELDSDGNAIITLPSFEKDKKQHSSEEINIEVINRNGETVAFECFHISFGWHHTLKAERDKLGEETPIHNGVFREPGVDNYFRKLIK